ncbi:hypothetical protein A1O1_05880 [Capronia coronata CBS 617.96]|uniref:FAD-binding FR-type domain-containing protein n=1 Tax=Capronia coronata CBS 617.96 TaxID=1182541 RepID=W9Y8F7_9EURO|nr:uncharacterized protein A1O1_05880 [Capronia coronata CBS 617.96]EXJ85516.1 hypothetical protein A1O1_05880 [Capronia coronata CBS 617.96]
MFAFYLATLASIVMAAQPSATSNSTSSGGSSQYQNNATQQYLNMLNKSLGHNYLWSLLAVVALLLAWVTVARINAHLRHLASMGGDGSLRYYSTTSPVMSLVKSNIVYAPILFYRRARELKFSRHVNFGSIPSRFQAIFLFLVIAANVFACTWNIPWSDAQLEVLPILRNRTGTLSVVNLIPIMVMASVKNPLIWLLDISYDTFNLMHRWFGRVAVLQAIVHTLCWLIGKVQSKGWGAVKISMQSPFIYSGLIATIGFTVMLLQSPKVFRSLSYEFFLHFHFVLALMVMVFLWRHLQLNSLPQKNLLLGAIIIWGASRGFRLATLLYRSLGRGGSTATVEPLPAGAVKITITTPRPWTYRPGQSLYLTLPALGLWTAHPFSVAWSGLETEDHLTRSGSVRSEYNEKNPIVRARLAEAEEFSRDHTVSLIVKKHTGLTQKLWHHARNTDSAVSLGALIEGPYGNERSMASYGTVILFASGVGITHQLGYVRDLVHGYSQGTVATRRITLVWVIPSTECLDWISSWMHEILGMEGRREVLTILLYVTRAGLSQSIRSPSDMVRMSRGRPNVEELIGLEAARKVGCIGVSVCAGGGLADEVRRVSRVMLDRGINLDFFEEGFGW